jgi:hypothetical protein
MAATDTVFGHFAYPPANARDAFGREPRAIASLSDATGSVAWLLQHGASHEARDRDEATALILAAQATRGSALPILIVNGKAILPSVAIQMSPPG